MRRIYLVALSLFLIGTISAQKINSAGTAKVNGLIKNKSLKLTKHMDHSFIMKGAKPYQAENTNPKAVQAALSEQFETSVPPMGWAATDWVLSSTLTSPNIETRATGRTGHFAAFDSYNLSLGTVGTLVTPKLMPATGNSTLSYKVQVVKMSTNTAYQGTGAELYIDISTDGGNTWAVQGSTNVLASIANFNTATTAWVTQTVDLTSYIGQTNVKVAFRAVSDYGWCDIGLDAVTGPEAVFSVNDVAAGHSMMDFVGTSYYSAIPFTQLGPIDFKNAVINNGSAAQTNVTLTVNLNNGQFTGNTGTNNPVASLAAGARDTLDVSITPTATTYTEFGVGFAVTSDQTDEDPANNVGDSIWFAATERDYQRASGLSSLLTPYSFGSGAPAATGMEYGANYVFLAEGQIDSISTIIYDAAGTGTVVGKLYSIDLTSGAFTLVAQTNPYTPSGQPEYKTLALTAPYTVPAGSMFCATVQLNCNVTGGDTIAIGADGGFPGDAAMAGACYINVGGTWGWYTITGTVPYVGVVMHTGAVSNGYTVSGNINYLNTANTALNGVTVKLMNGTTEVASATSSNGAFSFTNVANGSYTIECTTTSAWGGVTAVDVLKIKRHVAGLELLTGSLKLAAGDPNNSATITATDALKVQRRIAGLDTSFTKADWLFEVSTGGNAVTVNGADVTVNLQGICTGDVNGSNTPAY